MESFSIFELEPSWTAALKQELQKPYIASLAAFVEKERRGSLPIYPPRELVFNAFRLTPLAQVRVVIVGQDPYHGPHQAHGLCFSVPKGIPLPPSLKNIYKELAEDVGISPPQHGCLTAWAKQGVLLLNTTLTVRQSEPMSHHGKGWEQFTDAVIRVLCRQKESLIFLLWGKSAQEKYRHFEEPRLGDTSKHIALKAAHPSPFSAHQGFFGCRHFSQVNTYLKERGQALIDWNP
jgi:uracil-DNA glycosylase